MRAPFSRPLLRFSHFLDALIPLTDRLTAVSHYGSIWSAFRNLVISFDRYNLDPAIAKRLLKDLPPSRSSRGRHYRFKQHLGL